VDVEEDDVDAVVPVRARVQRAADAAQCLGRVRGSFGALDAGVGAQEVEQLFECYGV
jgi:hypothetical protein